MGAVKSKILEEAVGGRFTPVGRLGHDDSDDEDNASQADDHKIASYSVPSLPHVPSRLSNAYQRRPEDALIDGHRRGGRRALDLHAALDARVRKCDSPAHQVNHHLMASVEDDQVRSALMALRMGRGSSMSGSARPSEERTSNNRPAVRILRSSSCGVLNATARPSFDAPHSIDEPIDKLEVSLFGAPSVSRLAPHPTPASRPSAVTPP